MGTLLVGGVLLVIVSLVIAGMVKDRKAGKNACGCSCKSCPNSGACHPKG